MYFMMKDELHDVENEETTKAESRNNYMCHPIFETRLLVLCRDS